jgi:hypothetical protein
MKALSIEATRRTRTISSPWTTKSGLTVVNGTVNGVNQIYHTDIVLLNDVKLRHIWDVLDDLVYPATTTNKIVPLRELESACVEQKAETHIPFSFSKQRWSFIPRVFPVKKESSVSEAVHRATYLMIFWSECTPTRIRGFFSPAIRCRAWRTALACAYCRIRRNSHSQYVFGTRLLRGSNTWKPSKHPSNLPRSSVIMKEPSQTKI